MVRGFEGVWRCKIARMPLDPNALALRRASLEVVARGQKTKAVVVGTLTERQLGAINQARQHRSHPLPVVIAEVLFFGQYIYNSRVLFRLSRQ